MTSLFRTQSPSLRDYGWLSLFVVSYLATIGFVFLPDAAPLLVSASTFTSP